MTEPEVMAVIVAALSDSLVDKGLDGAADERSWIMGGPNAAARFDSLDLVSFVVAVESAIQDVTGRSLSLVDDNAINDGLSVFESVATLVPHVMAKLK